jgi:hypothetical protein
MRSFLVCIIIFSSLASIGQSGIELVETQWEKVLATQNPEDRIAENERLKNIVSALLDKQDPKAPPSTYKTNNFQSIDGFSDLISNDSLFRIINWVFPTEGDQKVFNTLFFHFSPNLKKWTALQAVAKNAQSNSAYYYQLITTADRFYTYYTLLGWQQTNPLTQRKVIDVVYVNKAGELHSARKLPASDSITSTLTYEYGARNTMKLNFIPEQNWILMDHLSPPDSRYEGIYEYYGADFSFDALQWEDGKWVLQEDIDADKGMAKSKKDFKPAETIEKPVLYQPK